MEPTELYEGLAISFPLMWPQDPKWVWVNVHDGVKLKVEILLELVNRTLKSPEVILLIRSDPGVALRVAREEVAEHIAKFILRYDIQLSDPQLNHFVSISSHGVATSDA